MRTLRRCSYFLYLLTVCSGIACAAAYPKPQSYVSDFAGVIDSDTEMKIEALVSEIEQKTGAEIAVVTVTSLNNGSLDSLAVELFQEWGVGKKGEDNGLLIIAAIADRKARIEVGYGLEGILPDGLVGGILDSYVIPEFKKGDYAQGMFLAALATGSVIAKDKGVELTGTVDTRRALKRKKPTLLQSIFNIFFLIVLAIVFIRNPFLFLLFMGMGGRGGGGGGFGGGFGGFGGGMSGGGGGSRGW